MVSDLTMAGIVAGMVLSIGGPVAAFFIRRRRMTLSWRNIAVGAGVFVLFALVLERALHYFVLQANPVTSTGFRRTRGGYVAYGLAAAALFEEVGRYLGIRLLVKPTGSPGTAVGYGIGHGGIEALLIGALAQFQLLSMAIMLNQGTLDATLGMSVPPATVASLHHMLETMNFLDPVYGGVERIVALLAQIALSLVVWKAVSERKPIYLGVAMGLHVLLDLPAAMYQAGLASLLAVQICMVVVGVALLGFFLMHLPKRASV